MQSHDYVPGVSGWKLSKGEFELNASRISVGGLPEQPQLVTVTAGQWPASDLPENAFEYYAFIGSEILKIPSEYRSSAEISAYDDSYEPGFASISVMLTYKRPETAEEASLRRNASKATECSISEQGGVVTLFYGGVPRIVLGSIDKTSEKTDTPFVVEDGQVFITGAQIADSVITEKMAPRSRFSVKMNFTSQDKYVSAGVGLGCTSELSQSLQGLAEEIKKEASARAAEDATMSARLGHVEAALNSLSARLSAKQ